MIPFGPLAPDAGDTTPGILTVANGVLPLREGYAPAPALSTQPGAEALPDDPRGIVSLVLNDGTWKVYAFTAGDWYSLDADYGWTSLTGDFACPDGDDWSRLHFGSYLLGTNTVDGLQAYNVETPAGFTHITDAGDPRFVFTSSNFVIGLDCKDESGTRNNRLIKTSGFNDHTNWKTDGADNQPLADGGALVFGADLKANSALVLQERAIRIMQFGDVGGGAQFSLQKLSDGVGSVGAKSCVAFDGAVYWIATDGFRKFSLAAGLETIGAGFVDDWFLTTADQGQLAQIQGAIDPLRKMVWWRFPRAGAESDTVFNDLIGYSWVWKRWVTASQTTAYLSQVATPGVVLDNMESYGDIDGIEIPLDSRFWLGGQPLFAALDADYKFSTFAGGNQTARFTTSIANNPVTGLIGWATPIDDAANGTLELGTTDQLANPIVWQTAASKVRNGSVPLRGRGLNIAFRYNIAAGETWSYAKGIDHVRAASGGPK